ncbi:putative RNA-directed DNA polymerase from transposon X-element [Nephila pilipes]|uniref:Putative RNA-directed DNA polymerase from transposon X-element n=1 Tax=Nephila pilipes TaxID=299642 RepID=A0A8X6TDC3_NEPPI|nr:putative RNA-directed DNA polymerase from transposon X-element [Nephila pilipes]
MSVESLRVKQKSLRSSFTMCCTSIEEALKKDTTLTDLYALQRQIMDKFTRLDTVQEHILELLLSDDLVSSEYEEDFTKAEKYRDKMNQLSAELENTAPTSEGLDSGRTLDRLMTFLRKEVESEEMILLARTGLGSPQRQKSKATVEEPFLATSAALVNTKGGRSGKQKFCLFCSQCNHWSSDCLIDNGSQKSYLTQRVIDHLNLKPVSKQTIVHGLFGGRETAPRKHFLYNVIIKSIDDSFSCQIKVLSENKICGYLPKVNDLQVLSEIKEKGIIVPDLCNSVNEIDMLLGADVISVILSGRTIKLKSGLIAIGTMLGFTLMGKTSQIVNDNNEIPVPTTRERQLSMFLNQLNVKELWDIETIGIRDPVENVKCEIQHSDMIERFQKNIETLPNGRYEVALPFKIEGQLTDNKELDVVPLDADAPKIPSANVDVSESTMIPVDAPPNRPKLSRYGRTIRRPKRLSVFNITTVFESE